MKLNYILLQAKPVVKGSYLKPIADWAQVIILLILVTVAYYLIKKALK